MGDDVGDGDGDVDEDENVDEDEDVDEEDGENVNPGERFPDAICQIGEMVLENMSPWVLLEVIDFAM